MHEIDNSFGIPCKVKNKVEEQNTEYDQNRDQLSEIAWPGTTEKISNESRSTALERAASTLIC